MTPTTDTNAAERVPFLIEGKTPLEFACEWYKPHAIFAHIHNAFDPARVPENVKSVEFAEWLARQYQLAMCKGIELARSAQKQAYAEQAAEIKKLTAERDHANLFTQVVLSSLHWTGDGYEWTGGRYDYRMQPSEAAALTTSEIEGLRGKVKDQAAAIADLQAELLTAKAAANSFRAQHAELNAELLGLSRRFDPNCDVYVYEDQANAMDAARQTVEAMQELATFLGRDPEGCLVDCADEAAGRIERAEESLADLQAKLTAIEARVAKYDDATPVDEAWCKATGFTHHEGLNIWRREIQGGIFVELIVDNTADAGIYFSETKRGGGEAVARTTKSKATRGQLTRLLEALGGVA